MEAKTLMTVNEFCHQHSLGRTTFYNEVRAGRLHVVKRGRRTLIARADAEAWLNALCEPPTAS